MARRSSGSSGLKRSSTVCNGKSLRRPLANTTVTSPAQGEVTVVSAVPMSGPVGVAASESMGITVAAAAANYSLKDIARSAAREAERELILRMLTRTRWNRKQAAEILGISYKALLYKIKENGLDKAS